MTKQSRCCKRIRSQMRVLVFQSLRCLCVSASLTAILSFCPAWWLRWTPPHVGRPAETNAPSLLCRHTTLHRTHPPHPVNSKHTLVSKSCTSSWNRSSFFKAKPVTLNRYKESHLIFCMECLNSCEILRFHEPPVDWWCKYLHVQTSSQCWKSMMRHWRCQYLIVLHTVRLQTKRRTF